MSVSYTHLDVYKRQFLYNDYAGKSDVMNEFMEYVYCLMYVGGITYSIKRVNSNVDVYKRQV